MSEQTANTLGGLNDHLFGQLDRLTTAKGDNLRVEIDRAKAMSNVANNIIENAKLALEAQRTLGAGKGAPAMLGIEAK
ncbi:MAG: hypothetical protein A2Y38_24815 [Spirochaetes bacterium GWB1_59_5]|nr:MAG: hypothetical protein A2Y38_24815 [Spirochaetes bacterium GWB1_59_5]